MKKLELINSLFFLETKTWRNSNVKKKKNVPSKNFTSDVLSTDGAISSTRLPQSPQKSSNTVPLIRVPSATISPEIFEESKITTQNYETRGTFNCWRAY